MSAAQPVLTGATLPPEAAVTGDVMVRFDGVNKSYRRGLERANLRLALPGRWGGRIAGDPHVALERLDLELRRGESLGIIGHNGAGKSTLLKLVAKVAAPTTGRVEVYGRTAALIELGAGFHPDMTGRENIGFSAAVLGMSRRELRSRTDQIIEFAGIDAFLDTPVKRYSSGMMARLGFGVAAHLDADVLVLDEVLSVGDAAFQRKCHARIAELRQSGTAILYVTHAMWSVPMLCQRAILLSRGVVVAAGTPSEVVEAYATVQAPVADSGAGRTEILAVTVDPGEIAPLQSVTIEADIALAEGLPAGYVLVSVHSADGTALLGVEHHAAFLTNPGRGQLRCTLPDLALAPGNYLVYVTVVTAKETPVIESQRTAELHILGETRPTDMYGTVAVAATWQES